MIEYFGVTVQFSLPRIQCRTFKYFYVNVDLYFNDETKNAKNDMIVAGMCNENIRR